MSQIAIRADGISKRYQLGGPQARYRTLRDSLAGTLTSPIRGITRMVTGQAAAAPVAQDILWALDDVSFTVPAGEVMGIIGRNGSGKSTLLKILSRIIEPTEGRARIHGRVGSLLEVGTGFHPELTGRENIFLSGAILGMQRVEIDRKFDEIVAFSEVERFLDTPVKFYSSGMYVRLAFAVAAHLETEILLVDEVLAVGDLAFQRKCLNKMSDVSTGEGRTVLFVSHNMVAVQNLCTQAILLNEGKLVTTGNTNDVVKVYLDAGVSGHAEHTWPNIEAAPGCAGLKGTAVRLRLPDGSVSSDVNLDSAVNVEIDYRVIQDGIKAGATVLLYSEDGVLVFSSISNSEPNWHGQPRPAGEYRSICQIPGNFLNSGVYRVSVLLWMANYSFCMREDNLVQFTVHDTGGAARGDYLGGMSGVVRPMLQWQTTQLSTGESID